MRAMVPGLRNARMWAQLHMQSHRQVKAARPHQLLLSLLHQLLQQLIQRPAPGAVQDVPLLLPQLHRPLQSCLATAEQQMVMPARAKVLARVPQQATLVLARLALQPSQMRLGLLLWWTALLLPPTLLVLMLLARLTLVQVTLTLLPVALLLLAVLQLMKRVLPPVVLLLRMTLLLPMMLPMMLLRLMASKARL